MSDRIFVDTNLWVYSYSKDDKSDKCNELLDKHFEKVHLSTQVLGEIFSVLTKKSGKTKKEAKQIISDLTASFNITDVLTVTINNAIDISIKYAFSYWDSLIIASALESNCSVLYTEDMQDGQIIDNTLKIVNPFTAKKSKKP
ncbi:MAG: PIN domain-containing protein [Ignavibacterium sp.]|nr:PIN domain-containing protein [Ignavibacterium sp.]